MKSTSALSSTSDRRRLSPLDIVVARYARAHGDGDHASPIFGCYLCLHGVRVATPEVREVAAAA